MPKKSGVHPDSPSSFRTAMELSKDRNTAISLAVLYICSGFAQKLLENTGQVPYNCLIVLSEAESGFIGLHRVPDGQIGFRPAESGSVSLNQVP